MPPSPVAATRWGAAKPKAQSSRAMSAARWMVSRDGTTMPSSSNWRGFLYGSTTKSLALHFGQESAVSFGTGRVKRFTCPQGAHRHRRDRKAVAAPGGGRRRAPPGSHVERRRLFERSGSRQPRFVTPSRAGAPDIEVAASCRGSGPRLSRAPIALPEHSWEFPYGRSVRVTRR